MKVRKWVDFGQEVEVDIGMDEIRTALAECFVTITADRLFEDGPTVSDVMKAFASVGSFLRAIKDEQIAQFNEDQRQLIYVFLKEQTTRYERSRVSQVTTGTTEG